MHKIFVRSVKRSVVGGVAAVALLVGGLLILPESAQAATSVAIPDAVAKILADTNALRAAGGLAPLVENAAMDSVAQNWSAQMYSAGALTHNPNYSGQIPAGWTSAGENIAMGYTSTTVVEAWHQSAGHYANIMGNYTDIGIGYYEANGQTYFTQDFGNYPGHAATASASAPAPVATSAPSPAPAPTPTAAPSSAVRSDTVSAPAPVAAPAAAPAPAAVPAPAAAPVATTKMRCVRYSHHHCSRYVAVKAKVVTTKVTKTKFKRVLRHHR